MGSPFDAGFNASGMLVHIIVRARAYRDMVGGYSVGSRVPGSDVLDMTVGSGTLNQTCHPVR